MMFKHWMYQRVRIIGGNSCTSPNIECWTCVGPSLSGGIRSKITSYRGRPLRARVFYMTRRAPSLSSLLIKNNTAPRTIFPGRPGGPHAHLEVSLCKTGCFSLQEHDSLMLAWLFYMLLGQLSGGSTLIFCHWSNGFWVDTIAPPTFSPARTRFWKANSWPDFVGVVLCVFAQQFLWSGAHAFLCPPEVP